MTNRREEKREIGELDEKLLAYLRGELGEADAKKLEDMVADDEEYAGRLERLLLGEGSGGHEMTDETLSDKQQRKILRRGKWRMRLTNSAFTFGIVFLAGALAFFGNAWVGSWMHADMFRVTKDLVNFTQSGVSAGSSGSQIGALYGQIKLELREQVGAEQKTAGFLEVSNFLWNVRAEPKWAGGIREKKLFFRYPTDEKMTGDETAYLRTPAWNAMSKLPEGTVSQLAISFDRPMTLKEYESLVAQHVFAYNMETSWLAVDTGAEARGHERDGGNLLLSAGEVWGVSDRALDYGDAPIQLQGDWDRRTATFMAEMKYLAEHERLTDDIGEDLIFGRDTRIAERYDYLQKHGVRIYGAVVTGPTKELLKLQAEKSITAAFLGKVDWWNWDRPGASGTEYSW